MSPEIDWQVQDDHGKEEIVHTPQPRSPRWRPIAIVVVIAIGVALGVIYRSIPEPPTPPIPTPIPTPPITQTIDQESQALAFGRMQAFIDLQDPDDSIWQQKQSRAFRAWGRPAAGDLYTIVESGTLSDDRVWADVIQFQDDEYFRQTRFYQLRNNHWRRIAPPIDAAFWGEEQTAQTQHFDLVYRAQDAAGAHLLADQLEVFYQRVCQDVECDAVKSSNNQRLTLVLLPDIATTASLGGTNFSVPITYALPSARLTGLHFQDLTAEIPDQNQLSNADDYGYIESTLLASIVFAATGDPERWANTQEGSILVGMIANWEQARIEPNQLGYDDTYWRNVLSVNQTQLPLEALWTSWPLTYTQAVNELMWAESSALIKFMDQQYGAQPIVEFLHALGPATSLRDAIESTGLVYNDFEKNWQTWLNKNFPK
jgi:hypothetical protein